MSEESLIRIRDLYAPRIEEACKNGRGRELLQAYVRDIATDFAETVFLRMSGRPFKSCQNKFAEDCAVDLAQSTHDSFTKGGMKEQDVLEFEDIGTKVFWNHLAALMELSADPGVA